MITTRPPRAARAPLLDGESDPVLARRVSHGDDRAFEVLIRRHRDPLSRYCRSILRHDQDAEDAFQATMVRAYRGLRRLDGDVNVRPWLFRIAHNECLRLVGSRPAHEPLSGAEEAVASRPAESAEAREDLRQLQADLLALPHQQRAALVLREMSGLSHQQIGEALGASPIVVKGLIHEARASLGEFGIGRSLACDEVQRRVSDGDGRVLRARAVRAHLRGCAGCREYREGIARRPRQLAALFPAIPLAVAERMVAGLVGGGSVSAGGAGLIAIAPGAGAKLAGVWVAAALVASGAAVLPVVTGLGPSPASPAASPAATAPATASAPVSTGVLTVPASAPGAPVGVPRPSAAPAGPSGAPVATSPAPAPAAPAVGGGGSAGPPDSATAAHDPTTPRVAVRAQTGQDAGITASAGAGGAGVSLDAGVGDGGVSATAAVSAPIASVSAGVAAAPGSGLAARAGATVAAPVAPPVSATVTAGASAAAGVAAAVTVSPVTAGAVTLAPPPPPVTVTVPPPATLLPALLGGG